MDNRKALPQGTVLDFQGIRCEIGTEVGRGSNAIVYNGSYRDALEQDLIHHVLVKELFPLQDQGKIRRADDGSVFVEPEVQELFLQQKRSFEAGNRAHLTLLQTAPEHIGANLNTYEKNGTLYTLLGVSGGKSLGETQQSAARSIRSCAARMIAILDALEIFHNNGLAHLDIAPDNILMLGGSGGERALLIDYNSALDVDAPRDVESFMFSVKQGYTAPEVRMGRLREIGFVSDMYSVTAVFYRLLTGSALTSFQMIHSCPPDVSGCPCLVNEPETVKYQVREILRRGLQTVPARRYRDTRSMRKDLEELIDRIDGVGITHWALWESGRRRVERMIRGNPSMTFICDEAKLFPSMVEPDGKDAVSFNEYIAGSDNHCLLLAGGGMGKTTALLRLAVSGDQRYTPDRPAILYLSLYGWKEGDGSFIVNSILNELHYQATTHTYEDAKKALFELFDRPLGQGENGRPAFLLLIDGFNEISYDPKPLLDEIRRLSALSGVRIVIASRTAESALLFEPLRLIELREETVRDALASAGLLLPESREMQHLLQTPMMLSMYIRAGQIGKKQVNVASPEELMREYLSALKEKAASDLSEQTDIRWQIETALEMVLPALAAEFQKKKRAMSDRELLSVVKECYRLLTGRLSKRFYPQWIGRTKAICGGAKNAEEWYGQIVHHLLWKRLGLIVRTEDGRYALYHQTFAAYLTGQDRKIGKQVKRYYRTRIAIAALALVLLSAASGFVYRTFFAPAPYDEVYAESVMDNALAAYVRAGLQYSAMLSLIEDAGDLPAQMIGESLKRRQAMVKNSVAAGETALHVLQNLLQSGKVMPWSGKPLDEKNYQKLVMLSSERKDPYLTYASVVAFAATDAYAEKYYKEEYLEKLRDLLEIDADIAAALYQIVCAPHLTGKYADDSVTANAYAKAYADVVQQNGHLFAGLQTSELRLQILPQLEGKRKQALSALDACGVFEAYARQSAAQ